MLAATRFHCELTTLESGSIQKFGSIKALLDYEYYDLVHNPLHATMCKRMTGKVY